MKIAFYITCFTVAFLFFAIKGIWAQDEAEKESSNSEIKKAILSSKKDLELDGALSFLPRDMSKSVSLTEAIEQGLRKNSDERIRTYDRKILDSDWIDTYETFWYPSVNLFLKTEQSHRIDKWKTGSSGDQNPYGLTPKGSLGLELGEYTVFNWGKDYLGYLNEREDYQRNRKKLEEERRTLRHQIILQFFSVLYHSNLVRIYQEQLKNASFVYRLGRQKANLGKLTKEKYYQARSEYLRAQTEFQNAKALKAIQEEELAYLIGDDLSTRYSIHQELNFRPLSIDSTSLTQLAFLSSSQVLDAKQLMENSNRDYQVTLKENLPLPKFTLNLGTYAHQFDKDSNSGSYYTEEGSKNIELVASINATWPLFGEGGFFKNRTNQRSMVNKLKYEQMYNDAKRSIGSSIRKNYQAILSYQEQFKVYEKYLETAEKSYDVHLQNYINNKSKFLDLRQAMINLKDAQLGHEGVKFFHLKEKINLAINAGIEDFPGESFDKLAISSKVAD